MPDYTVSGDVDSMLRSANDAAIRSAIGVGTTDAPTFLAQTLTSQGLANAPSLAIGTGAGFYQPTNTQISFSGNNTEAIRFTGGGIRLGTNDLGWGTFAINNLILTRDADGILAQRNGDNAQSFRVYDSYNTAGANFCRANLSFNSNRFELSISSLGTGSTTRGFDIGTNGTGSITFFTGGSNRWQISGTTGQLLPMADNAYDIGASGARARNIYVAGSINVASAIIGAGQTGINASGVITMLGRFNLYPPSDGVLTMSNNAGTGFTRLELGSTNLGISRGTGSPEGVVTALVGSLYIRTDGGASTTLYVKESGAGNTGWVAK